MLSAFRLSVVMAFAGLLFVSAGYTKTDYTFHTLYVYNFTKYIEWPAAPKELVIGVSGGNPEIVEAFEKMAILKTTSERKYTIKPVMSPADADKCQLLFLPGPESSKLPLFASRSIPNCILVTEGDGLLKKGGMINFLLVDRKLRFELDQPALEKAGLRVSAQLVGMAVQ
ncbi:YfiR family protein [Cesiribacter andamanensis]|uniref:DUF4154 domain-containing protein n=1 Tax=Cesiribacter andamanensis AMV16 TaxID=1279009 RepID=M7NL34_9BACT|nr:YfiR family protein [Cesiribacter andamanensis]EMR02505.1 hypothetical protein ADICEAN_02378 [Cesiribacter andamanensis AMV16]